MTKIIYKVFDLFGIRVINNLLMLVVFAPLIFLSDFSPININSNYVISVWVFITIFCLIIRYIELKYVAVIKEFTSCEERLKYIMQLNGKAANATIVAKMLKRVDRDDVASLFLNYAAPMSKELPKFKKLNKDEKYQVLSYESKYKLVNSIVYENECVKHVIDYTDASIYNPETKFFFDLNIYMNSYFKLKKYEVNELGFGEYLDD